MPKTVFACISRENARFYLLVGLVNSANYDILVLGITAGLAGTEIQFRGLKLGHDSVGIQASFYGVYCSNIPKFKRILV